MQFTMLGSIGLGFVWGWLLIQMGRGSKRPWRSGIALTLMTILFSVLLLWLYEWRLLLAYLVATTVSFSTHLAWRNSLMQAPEK